MKLVVDTNILFSFFWEGSLTKKLLIGREFELYSQEIALSELKKYSEEIIRKAKISKQQFNCNLSELKSFVKFVQKEKYLSFAERADSLSPDKYDSDFFALCLSLSCPLWSNDEFLKHQETINIISTKELIEILF